MTDEEKKLCGAVLNVGWSFAIQKTASGKDNIRGLIIGDIGYIKYILNELDDEYTIMKNPKNNIHEHK